MRIVVTGASGFIGSALCRRLAGADDEVIAVMRGPAAAGATVHEGTRLVDFPQDADWRAIVNGVDAVVHLAGIAHRRGVREADLRRINVELTARLAQAAASAGARFVYLSSAKVYGDVSGERAFDERSPVDPRDAYARSKVEAEEAIRSTSGLRWVVLRPPLVYGPGVKANLLLLMRAVANGIPLPLAGIPNRRSLIGIGNLCDAIARCVRPDAAAGGCFPVDDGAAVSTSALCRELGAALGRPARLFACPAALLEPLPPMRSLTRSLELDSQAFRDRFAWSPLVTREAGLKATARWFLTPGQPAGGPFA